MRLSLNLNELLQSTGPITVEELAMRVGGVENAADMASFLIQLEQLRKGGVITATGPGERDLSTLDVSGGKGLRQTIVELSRSSLRRSFAS